MKFIDIPIGKTVKYHGKRGVCTEVKDSYSCSKCILLTDSSNCILLCTKRMRKDGKDVYFKETPKQPCEEQKGDNEWCNKGGHR